MEQATENTFCWVLSTILCACFAVQCCAACGAEREWEEGGARVVIVEEDHPPSFSILQCTPAAPKTYVAPLQVSNTCSVELMLGEK